MADTAAFLGLLAQAEARFAGQDYAAARLAYQKVLELGVRPGYYPCGAMARFPVRPLPARGGEQPLPSAHSQSCIVASTVSWRDLRIFRI